MKWLIILLPLILLAIPVHATLLTLNATDDTYTYSAIPTNNYSTFTTWIPYTQVAGSTQVFLKFNISALPANSTIYNAYITTYAIFSRVGTGRSIEIYNTTNAWTEYNLTWANKPAAGTLLSNTSGVDYTVTGRKNFTVTAGVNSTYTQGNQILSLMLRDSIINGSTTAYQDFASKEYPTVAYREQLVINYTLTDCIASCGACGCNAAHDSCYTPPLVGSYCAIDENRNNTIKTVNSACGTTYLDCPAGTACTQISPLINMTVFPTTPGAANLPYCHQCVFVNMKIASAPLASTYTWVNVWTNCPDNPECNCLGWLCSNNLYEAPNITAIPYSITEWTAGCFNPSTGFFVNVTNSTGGQTTITDLVNNSCGGNCTITNNTPQTQCPFNTTTVCYDIACNNVPCSTVVSSTCASNTGGQLALSVGGLMGITDCGLAQNILAILTSIIIGFAIMFYTKESEHSGQAFIFGTISMLVMFTLIGWFASWLMVVLIVIGGYLVAKSLGLGGG